VHFLTHLFLFPIWSLHKTLSAAPQPAPPHAVLVEPLYGCGQLATHRQPQHIPIHARAGHSHAAPAHHIHTCSSVFTFTRTRPIMHVINARTHHAGVSRRTIRARPCRGSQARRGRGSHCGDWDQDPSNKLHESSRALRGFSQASWCGLHLPLPGELCYKLLCMWSTCSTRVDSCKRCPAVWALAM